MKWYEEQAEKADELTAQIRQMKELNRQTDETVHQLKNRLDTAVTQYNELAEVARQLQIEGKKWRDKYYQETKKKRVRPPGAE